MTRCVEILRQSPTEDFKLEQMPNSELPFEHCELEKLIGHFWNRYTQGIRIGIICGKEDPWDSEYLLQKLQEYCAGDWKERYVCLETLNDKTLQSTDIGVATVGCTNFISEGETKKVLESFFKEIQKILAGVNEKCDSEKGEKYINAACGEILVVGLSESGTMNAAIAKEITDNLVGQEDRVVENCFPNIMILAFLPQSMFTIFSDSNNCFFKQIEWVAHFENLEHRREVEKLKNEQKKLIKENGRLNEEVGWHKKAEEILINTTLEEKDREKVKEIVDSPERSEQKLVELQRTLSEERSEERKEFIEHHNESGNSTEIIKTDTGKEECSKREELFESRGNEL